MLKLHLSKLRYLSRSVKVSVLKVISVGFFLTGFSVLTVFGWDSPNEMLLLKTDNATILELKNLAFQIEITGRVVDESGNPVEGVSVTLKSNSSIGTTTDENGSFSLRVMNRNDALVFSSVGFVPKESPIGSGNNLSITLVSDVGQTLSDVVVTALGIQRERKSLTYSVQSVNTEDMTKAREVNVLSSLQGKVAGMSMITDGSGVGAGAQITLRGDRSLRGSSQPLYVIDGAVGVDPTTLSPDDIASVSVLKGANAAALYGSLAQNGVIIMETKKGREGKTSVTVSQTYMAQHIYKNYFPFQFVYGQGFNGVYSKSADASFGPKMEGQMVDTWSIDPEDAGKQYAFVPQSNAKTDFYDVGHNSATNIGLNMGNAQTQGYLSYTYTDAAGIIPTNWLNRHNVTLRVTSKLSKRLTADAKISLIQQKENNRHTGSTPDITEQIYNTPVSIRLADLQHYEFIDPNTGLRTENYWNPATVNGQNMYWIINRVLNEYEKFGAALMTSLTYDFTSDLKLMGRVTYDAGFNNNSVRNYSGTMPQRVGVYSETKGQSMILNTDVILTYDRDFFQDFHLNANVGVSALKMRGSSLSGSIGQKLLIADLFAMSNTNTPTSSYSPGSSKNKNSVYGFATIGWKDMLFADISGRNDWSSTLPSNNRSYFYPSFGLSASLTDIAPSLKSIFSFAKVRFSRAIVGNDAEPYMLQRTASLLQGGTNGFLQFSSTIPAENLMPEKTYSNEIGVDLRFFDNRLNINVTGYKTSTRNQLFTISLPVGTGASELFTNGGDVSNKGVEVVVGLVPVRSQDWTWEVDLNYYKNSNVVEKISTQSPRITISESYFGDFVMEEGQPYGNIYGKGFQRDAQGRVIVGTDGMPKLTSGKTVLISNLNPDWLGSLSSNLRYKNFNFSFLIDTRQGGTIASQSNAILDGWGLTERTLYGREGGVVFGDDFFPQYDAVLEDGSKNNIQIKTEDFWTRIGGRNSPTAEPFVEDATNTRLREVTFGYSLPTEFLKNKIGFINSISVSLVGRNLFFIHRASQYVDAEVMRSASKVDIGRQYFNPPTSRFYGFNVKIGF